MKNILIVEDDYISGKMLKDMLKGLGHNVIGIASSAEKALFHIKEIIPDLVFMDINLSGELDGLHLTELLSGFYKIDVVFVTIHADSKTIAHAKKSGKGYIIKPFTLKEIESSINNLPYSEIKVETEENNTDILHIKDDNCIIFLSISNIIYIEAQAHSMILNTKEKSYVIRSSLKDILSKDVSNTLVQVHRSYILNKDYIEQLINDNYMYKVKMKHLDSLIPVSRKNFKKIKSLI